MQDSGSARAEAAVIGSMLIDPEAVEVVAALLAVDDFAHAGMRRAYRAMRALRDRGIVVDYATVCGELGADLPRVGEANLTAAINLCPTSLHAVDYALTVAEQARRRANPAPAPSVVAREMPPIKPPLMTRLGLDAEDDEVEIT